MANSSSYKKIARLTIGLIAWFALVLQLYLMLLNNPALGIGPAASLINFFSYFTILSNLFVAITLSVKTGSAFSSFKAQSAIAVYIFIVGLVYNLVLRNIWSPTGWQLVADNLLHVAVPVIYLVYWFLFVRKKLLEWKHLLPWLVFPAIYLAYSLIRGAVTGWYPYPFLNADEFGYGKVALNSALVLAAFIVTGLAIIAIDRSGPSTLRHPDSYRDQSSGFRER